jgi:ribonuclease III family protein
MEAAARRITMELNLSKKTFSVDSVRQLNPLVMAFVGDAVFELIVRTHLVSSNTELSAHKLHISAISYVKAHAQSELMKKIMEMLTEEELWIFKRGRNTKSATVPKNADVQEYRMATGFEALVGYLYLTNQEERLMCILKEIIN